MRNALLVTTAVSTLASSADAGLAGFVAYSRNVGTRTVIDVFAAVTNASDKFLNVYDLTSNGTFVQKAGLATKTWKPDTAGFTSTRAVSDDSFMTAGTYAGGSYGGDYYASGNSYSDPNFTGTSWSGTPASAAATTIPNLAGWFTGDPTSVDNYAEVLGAGFGFATSRTDSALVSAAGGYAAPANSLGTTYGIWVSHLVVNGINKQIGVDFTFAAYASIKDGVTGWTTQARYQFTNPPVPAPGAIGLLAIAGARQRRRR
jgi:hypothetical protein